MSDQPNITQLLPDFNRHRRRLGMRPYGIERYAARLRRIDRWLRKKPVDTICIDDMQDYVDACFDRECSPEYILNELVAVKAFALWAIEQGYMTENPVDFPWPKRRRGLPRPLSTEEMTALWAVLDQQPDNPRVAWSTRRARLIVLLQLYAGLRRGEVATLRWKHVDLQAGRLVVVDGKGGKDRVLALHPSLRTELTSWATGQSEHKAVVTTEAGRPMTVENVAKLYERWLPERGVRISSHRLRHTFATELLRACGNLGIVQQALGHSSPEVTAVYAQVVVDDMMAAIVKMKAPPPPRRHIGYVDDDPIA